MSLVVFINECLYSVHFYFALVVKDRNFLAKLRLFRQSLMLLIWFNCSSDIINSWMFTA